MGASDPVVYSPEGLFNQSCLECLMEKAKQGDPHARRALHFLSCLTEFMACRMLAGPPGAPCSQRTVKPLPGPLHPLYDNLDCGGVRISTNDKLQLLVSGTAHAIIEDEEWDRRGTGSP